MTDSDVDNSTDEVHTPQGQSTWWRVGLLVAVFVAAVAAASIVSNSSSAQEASAPAGFCQAVGASEHAFAAWSGPVQGASSRAVFLARNGASIEQLGALEQDVTTAVSTAPSEVTRADLASEQAWVSESITDAQNQTKAVEALAENATASEVASAASNIPLGAVVPSMSPASLASTSEIVKDCPAIP